MKNKQIVTGVVALIVGVGIGYFGHDTISPPAKTGASAFAGRTGAAGFAGRRDDPAECDRRIDEIVRWRREHQPGGQNAGSVFTNPPGDSAGRLIESCGLKGLEVGGAVVSEKHANFFAASPGARADDVFALIRLVQDRVEAATGVRLVPELQLVGFAGGSEEASG